MAYDTSVKGDPGLLKLPDELLVLVVSHLHTIQLDQPQSQAFKDRQKERVRQYKNHVRRAALYSLSLTSRKLNGLALPVLYCSIASSASSYGLTTLRLFWKTLMIKPELVPHVQYVENMLSDYLGNDLRDEVDTPGVEDMIYAYFTMLAAIILMCHNIQQMSIISIESPNFTLWERLLSRRSGAGTLIAKHGLPKLKTLAFQTNAAWCRTGPAITSYFTILSALSHCPAIEVLRASGLTAGSSKDLVCTGSFTNLQRLELTECTLILSDIDNILNFCMNLTQFICHWSFLTCNGHGLALDQLPGLVRHRQTLEVLWLVARTVHPDDWGRDELSYTSFRQMTALKEAKLINFFIPYKGNRPSAVMGLHPLEAPPIAPELPPSLEHLTILYSLGIRAPGDTVDIFSGVLSELFQMTCDCQRYLPRLRELVVQFDWSGFDETEHIKPTVTELTKLFKSRGVLFTLDTNHRTL